MTTDKMSVVRCPECQREMRVEPIQNGVRVTLQGVGPAPCCQRSATDGHRVMGLFITEP